MIERIDIEACQDGQKKSKEKNTTMVADFEPYWRYRRGYAEKKAAGLPEDQCYTISQGLPIALGIMPC